TPCSGCPTIRSSISPRWRTAPRRCPPWKRSAPSRMASANAASNRPSPPSRSWSAITECSQPTRSTEGNCIMQHEIVSREEWLAARTALLDAEKKLAEARTTVVDQRRALPWTRVEKEYEFDAPAGRQTLADLFNGRGRLIVYHFMFAPEWQDGCPGCSHLADYFDGMGEHLGHHDATFVAISRAPIGKID